MKINHQIAFALSTLLLSAVTPAVIAATDAPVTTPTATDSTKPSGDAKPKSTPANGNLTRQDRQELDQRREKERLQKVVDESLKNSPAVRNQVQEEVSRSFGFTTSLLNTLLFLLILFPVAGIIAIWLFRRNLANQIKSEVKEELGEEVKAQLVRVMGSQLVPNRQETAPKSPQADMNGENVGQLKDLISMAMATQNLISETRHSIEESMETQAKAESLLKDVFDRYGNAPTSIQSQASLQPDVENHPAPAAVVENRLPQTATAAEIIDDCEKAIEVNDDDCEAWCTKGVALTQMGRYEEAIKAFNQALRRDSDYADAWYEKSRCYALQGNVDSAIENLKQSINLNSDKKYIAKTDPCFDQIRENEWFHEVIAS